jgi:hypothetical protein
LNDEEARSFFDRWWKRVWHDGDVGLMDELVAERYVQHSARGNVVLDRGEFKKRMVQYQRVLHGAVTTVDDYTVDGDKLWMRATSRGANLEANAASIVTWLIVYRFEAGRVVEAWVATVPDIDWTTGP